MVKENTIHSFKVPSIDGGEIDFSTFKGKKVLVVNTASDCEYTTQYRQLQELFANYKNNLVVVGFPSNNFGEQKFLLLPLWGYFSLGRKKRGDRRCN